VGWSDHILDVDESTFEAEVLLRSHEVPVVVDFWAAWCGPCKALAPILEEVAREQAGRVLVAKVNIDESPFTASRFAVSAVPTLVLFSGGLELDRRVGVVPKREILAMLERAGGTRGNGESARNPSLP